jgi:hypothetical protein
MKLYLAAIYTNRLNIGGKYYCSMTEQEKQHRLNIRYILESYHYVEKDSYVRDMRQDGAKVFLDSGAFSAFTKGVEVDLDAYCKYIHRNQDILECASVLDGIGDPRKTWENQRAMESNGTKPLPCFHYGEDERYLVWYLDRYEYITLGGMVPISKPQLKLWLDRMWSKYLTKPDGTPRIKVHGFGMTTLNLMLRYPWYSVDSSSWVQMGSVGNILLPGLGTVSISETSPRLKDAGQHTENIPEMQREALVAMLAAKGFDYQRLKEEYVSRWIFNCASYREINVGMADKVVKYVPDQLSIF